MHAVQLTEGKSQIWIDKPSQMPSKRASFPVAPLCRVTSPNNYEYLAQHVCLPSSASSHRLTPVQPSNNNCECRPLRHVWPTSTLHPTIKVLNNPHNSILDICHFFQAPLETFIRITPLQQLLLLTMCVPPQSCLHPRCTLPVTQWWVTAQTVAKLTPKKTRLVIPLQKPIVQ